MNPSRILGFAVGPIGTVSLPTSTWMFGAQDIGRIAMMQALASLVIIQCGLVAAPSLAVCALGAIAVLTIAIERFALAIFCTPEPSPAWTTYRSHYFSLVLRQEECGSAFSMSQLLPRIIFFGALLLMYLGGGNRILVGLLAFHLSCIRVTSLIFAWIGRHLWLPPQIRLTDESHNLDTYVDRTGLLGTGCYP